MHVVFVTCKQLQRVCHA